MVYPAACLSTLQQSKHLSENNSSLTHQVRKSPITDIEVLQSLDEWEVTTEKLGLGEVIVISIRDIKLRDLGQNYLHLQLLRRSPPNYSGSSVMVFKSPQTRIN